MEDINVSVDRIVIEYTDVYWSFFNPFKQRICDYYGIKEEIHHKGFVYHLHLQEGQGIYLHISYQNCYEKKSIKHSLRIETHPENLVHFRSWLDALHKNCSAIRFIRCDVAFDVSLPLNNVFTTSKTGRKMNQFKGTRYFGGGHQRQQHGYCRVYDKKAEQKDRKGIELQEELTRMEIVYQPKDKILLENLVQHPPKFNRLYECTIISNLALLKPEKKAIILAVQHNLMNLDEFTYYHRTQLSEMMDSQQKVDLDALAESQWREIVTVPCALLCGTVNFGKQVAI